MTDNVVLDRDQWVTHHSAVWGQHQWPDGTILSIMTRPGGERMSLAGKAAVSDADALWRIIEPAASRGHCTYISVGGLEASLAGRSGRGKKDDVVGLPALIVDLDFAGSDHAAGDRNPTGKEAAGWVDAFSQLIVPSVVNHSGGGAHVWLTIEELLDWRNPEHAELLVRWKHWWVALAAQAERNIDDVVLNDPSRMLRPAGSWNGKQGKPVRTTRPISNRLYSVQELLSILPPLPTPNPKPARTPTRPPGKPADEAVSTRIGDRFALQIPVSEFCSIVFDAESDGGSGLTFPRADGTVAEDSNARIYPGEETTPERLTVFGQRVLEEFDLDSRNSLTSFDFVAKICGGGDAPNYKSAAVLLRQHEVDGSWEANFLELLREVVKGTEELSNAAAAMPALSVGQALQSSQRTEVELENNLVVMVNPGAQHGLFKRVWEKTPDGSLGPASLQRVTSWLAWKAAAVRHLSVDALGEVFEVAEPTFTCQVVDSFGRRTTKAGFTSKEAHDPRHVLNTLDPGVPLPDSVSGLRQVESMLRTLGRHDSMNEQTEFHTLGWMKDPNTGRHVFLAPSGSVSADGPTDRFTVGPPAGSHPGAGTAAQKVIGFPDIPKYPDHFDQVGLALQAFLNIVPGRLDLGAALLGILFAAPLALSRRCTVLLVAEPDSGKSMLTGALQAFLCPDFTGKSFTGGPLNLDSGVAAQVKQSWLRHTLAIWDDFNMGTDPLVNIRIRSTAENLIRLTYGSDGQTGGTQGGGIRATRSADTCMVISGEGTPTGEGVVSRMVRIVVKMNDIELTPQGSSALDMFKSEHAVNARRLYGAYLQTLALRLDEIGLPAFAAENDAIKREWLAAAKGRSAETVAVLGVGWVRLRAFAERAGIALPTEAAVRAALDSLVAQNVEAVADSNPALSVIDKVRDMLASRSAYVDTHDGEVPSDNIARQMGWNLVYQNLGNGTIDEVWKPASTLRAGFLSADRRFVVITNETLSRVKRDLGMTAVPEDQMKRAAKQYVVAGTEPGARTAKEMFAGRQRGWVVLSSDMDIDTDPPPAM